MARFYVAPNQNGKWYLWFLCSNPEHNHKNPWNRVEPYHQGGFLWGNSPEECIAKAHSDYSSAINADEKIGILDAQPS
jgi:hypothetical protein